MDNNVDFECCTNRIFLFRSIDPGVLRSYLECKRSSCGVIYWPQSPFISFSPTFRLGFSIFGIPNHFQWFPPTLVWPVEKGSKSTRRMPLEQVSMRRGYAGFESRPTKTIKMVPNSG